MTKSLGGMGPGVWHGVATRVIGAIYRDPTGASWAEALDMLAQVHEATWAHIHVDDSDIDAPRVSVPNASADPGILKRFHTDGFGPLDPRPAMLAQNDGKVTACWELLPPADFDRTIFVNEFLDTPENNIRWSMAGGHMTGNGARVLFGVARPRHSGAFDEEDVRALSALAPHIIGAIELHESLRLAERTARLPVQMGELEGIAMVGVDRRGRLAITNVSGGAALARGRDIKVVNGQVHFSDPRAQAALEAALTRTEDAAPFKLSDGRQQIKILTLPDVSSPVVGALPPIRVLIEMREMSQPSLVATLSTRERQVAELLAKGMTPPQIAETLGKSIETVRTQLKAAMRKIKVNRQSQLVRAMLGENAA